MAEEPQFWKEAMSPDFSGDLIEVGTIWAMAKLS
jgi:hypothetical protein